MKLYVTAEGAQRVTCNGHRAMGYYFYEGVSTCRVCHMAAALHETFEETAARKAGN